MIERIQWELSDLPDVPPWPDMRAVRVRKRTSSELFDVCRIDWMEPYRSRALYVFPFDEPRWSATIRDLFEFEVRTWRAFWRVAERRGLSDLDDPRVSSVSPLWNGDLDNDVRHFLLDLGTKRADLRNKQVPALLRPSLEWPTANRAPTEGELARLAPLIQAVWREAGHQEAELELSRLVDGTAAQHLLFDGHRMVPTQWRLLHVRWATLRASGQ